MPPSLQVSLDGRSGARVRELEVDLGDLAVSSRSALGRTVCGKWAIKEVSVPSRRRAPRPR